MALSNSTIHNLANTLTLEIIDYIYKDERWVEFLMEMIPDALEEKLGKLDENLCVKLSQCIMNNIEIITSK